MKYYKYRPYSQRTLEILLNQEIYFPSSEKLNDPLDSRIDIDAEYQKVVASLDPTKDEATNRKAFLVYLLNAHDFRDPNTKQKIGLNQALQRFIQTVGILSLSKTPTDPLLWSHYAASHTGICLGFDIDKIQSESIFARDEVTYLAAPPYQAIFLSLAEQLGEFMRPWDKQSYPDELGDKFYTKQISELMRGNLFVKSEKWKYEEEYRIVQSNPGMQGFPPEALQVVILGTKTTAQNSKTIENILKIPGYSHVKFKRAMHIPGSFEFDIVDA